MKPRVQFGAFVAAGLVIAAGLAFFVSPQASSQPDGLERVTIDKGIDPASATHALQNGPTAGYAVRGVDDDRLATGLAGVLGVTATFAVAAGLVLVLRRFRALPPSDSPA